MTETTVKKITDLIRHDQLTTLGREVLAGLQQSRHVAYYWTELGVGELVLQRFCLACLRRGFLKPRVSSCPDRL